MIDVYIYIYIYIYPSITDIYIYIGDSGKRSCGLRGFLSGVAGEIEREKESEVE